MIEVITTAGSSPAIATELKKIINNLDHSKEYVLSLQLDYREHNTIFYINKLEQIDFQKNMLKISQVNGSHIFIDYKNILEYCVINADDVLELS